MILISKIKRGVYAAVFCFIVASPAACFAEDPSAQTISVSPTLFQITATPAQVWQSEIRVINVNEYDLTIYPQVVNFAPQGEAGKGDLIPVFAEETKGKTLAEWISISSEGIVVPKQQTVAIPFSVTVPSDAAPGGHYAAILVGTKPPVAEAGHAQVQTAQFVTSLFFAKVAGDVLESGSIREFRTEEMLLPKPAATFELRFENTGNVHLQPQGDITIYNMWGEDRGVIPINHQTHFGNVLPQSIRKFVFSWEGEAALFDIGRYKAIATLGYGDEQKNFVTSTTYFWIIPFKQILIFGVVFFGVVWFFSFAVKLYVRRMLTLAGVTPHQQTHYRTPEAPKQVKTKFLTRAIAPLRNVFSEFTLRLKQATTVSDVVRIIGFALYRSWIFVLVLVVVVGIVVSLLGYWHSVKTTARPFQVTIENPDVAITLSSEEILYQTLKTKSALIPATRVPELENIRVTITNVSGIPGKAAALRLSLEAAGYTVSTIDSDTKRSEQRTSIVYNPDQSEVALALSKRLGGALLSADITTELTTVKIFVANDQP